MKAHDLFSVLPHASLHGPSEVRIEALGYDSRSIQNNHCFIAIPGTLSDGHAYIAVAIAAGATAIVCQTLPLELNPNVCYCAVPDSAAAAAALFNRWYNYPSERLQLVGVTGTNGKTTTASLLFDLFTSMGYVCGLISTVIYRIGSHTRPATHTTPDTAMLTALLNEMAEVGCQYCFMEVSSHSVVQERIAGLTFKGGIFTNITQDHLDFHKTFEAYIKAKQKFFSDLPKTAFALTNLDDRNGTVMLQNCKARRAGYAMQHACDFPVKIIESHMDGTLLELDGEQIWVNFIGSFNAYNLCAVYGAARLLGAEKSEILRCLSSLKPVSGRFENLHSEGGLTAIVDYAHTPDALENVLETILKLRQPGQRIITVVGCGGNRDAGKRPIMAKIAAERSDTLILTSDNPRLENPLDILHQMEAGLDKPELKQKSLTIEDRKAAIRTAVHVANPRDILLIAGKGHEDYQIIGTTKHHFDDKEVVRACFIELKK